MRLPYKALLKHLLDHHATTPEALAILSKCAPTEALRATAGVLRHRFWGRLQGVFRLYGDIATATQCWQYEQTLGYRTALAPEHNAPQSWAIIQPHPFTAAPQTVPTIDGSGNFLAQLHLLIASHATPSMVVFQATPTCTTDELVRFAAMIRLTWPSTSLAIRGNETKLLDLTNVTLMEHEHPAESSSPSLFEDELYRTIRSRHIPYHRFLPPIADTSQLGALEGEAALCLRELCSLIPDEDTRVDLIRFSNHNLFTNVPRFPYGYQQHLQRIDDGHAPQLLRV